MALGPLAGCSGLVPDPLVPDLAAQPGLRHERGRRVVERGEPADAADARARNRRLPPLFDDIERRTFDFFWATGNPVNGLVPDRYPSTSPCSIAAIGFALTAYVIGVDRGYVTRDAGARAHARHRALLPRRAAGAAGARHDRPQGILLSLPRHEDRRARLAQRALDRRHRAADRRHAPCAGLLRFATTRTRSRSAPRSTRSTGASTGSGRRCAAASISMGWSPEKGFIPYDWARLQRGDAGGAARARLADAPGRRERLERLVRELPRRLGPLHGLRAPQLRAALRPPVLARLDRLPRHPDATMRQRGIDYFENTRRAVYAQRAYAIANPKGWYEYGANVWGFTACDGPGSCTSSTAAAGSRYFLDYSARGAGRSAHPRRRHDRADRRRSRRCRSRPRS